jgi:hypothetical protein
MEPLSPRPAGYRTALGWAAVVLVILVEYTLFRQYVLREVAWAYPANWDQIAYLTQAYDTYEHVLDEGPRRGLQYGYHLPSPNGTLLHLEAALLFLVTGANRLGALTLNFLHFALYQLALVGTLRWLTRRWDVPLLGLGLALAAISPFIDGGGGIADFRIDFIASCLSGLLLCLVIRSGVFASRPWSLAVGAALAGLALMRFITLVYLAGIAAGLALLFAVRWWWRRDEGRGTEARRLGGLVLAGVAVASLTLPVLWERRQVLKDYYVVGHLTGEEKNIRGQKTGNRFAYYPESLVSNHAGPVFLRLAGGALALAAALRLFRRVPPGAAARLDLGAALPAMALALVVPWLVLSVAAHRSPIVINVALPAVLWLVLLAVVGGAGLHREAQPRRLAGWALAGLASVTLLAGAYKQAWWYGHRTKFTARRGDVEEALRLHDRIEECCAANRWLSPVFSFTSNADFLYHQVSNVLMYERHGSRRKTLGLLGQGILKVSLQDALNQAAASDFVLLARPYRVVYPFEQSMIDVYPELSRLCREQFVEQDTYRVFEQDVTLYVRPSLRPTAPPHAWVGQEGLRLEGPAGALRGCRVLQLQGWADFSGMDGLPVVRAELHSPGRAPRQLPATLAAEGSGYHIEIDCAGQGDVYTGPVELRLTFDCSGLHTPAGKENVSPHFLRVPHAIQTVR